jgi:hypothetical protein
MVYLKNKQKGANSRIRDNKSQSDNKRSNISHLDKYKKRDRNVEGKGFFSKSKYRFLIGRHKCKYKGHLFRCIRSIRPSTRNISYENFKRYHFSRRMEFVNQGRLKPDIYFGRKGKLSYCFVPPNLNIKVLNASDIFLFAYEMRKFKAISRRFKNFVLLKKLAIESSFFKYFYKDYMRILNQGRFSESHIIFRFSEVRVKKKKGQTKVKVNHYKYYNLCRLYYGAMKPFKFWQRARRVRQKQMGGDLSSYYATLELRLDVLLARLSIMSDIFEARQWLRKGTFSINNKTVYNTGVIVRTYQIVTVRNQNFKLFFLLRVLLNLSRRRSRKLNSYNVCIPKFIEFSFKLFSFMCLPYFRPWMLTLTPFSRHVRSMLSIHLIGGKKEFI